LAAEVIRLKGSSAPEIACVLDELFNGGGAARKARVVVLALPLTDCLFIVATTADLRTIRKLLRPL
jgi:hypothetical protein